MSEIIIQGYHPLRGELEVQGSKNAVLPMMAAALLHRGTTVLTHVPRIQDVSCMMGILESVGCGVWLEGHTLAIDAAKVTGVQIPEERGKAMRSSIILLGALLGRCGEAFAHYPGGCSIGSRPIDMHISALKKLGADMKEESGILHARAGGLKGAPVTFSYPSVGATEQALLAAASAEGITVITGAAKEPEVEALCRMLEKMGAEIQGIGTGCLKIRGTRDLREGSCEVPGDRIVTGTYLSAVMAAGGEAVLRRGSADQLGSVFRVFQEMGAKFRISGEDVEVRMNRRPRAVPVETGPYPDFPTDLQSMALALLALGEGEGRLKETVFEGRFATAKELHKMGAAIIIEGKEARVAGKKQLEGAKVTARDLRGGAALAVAGLGARGETRITDCYHIQRGYEDICRDLAALGADIRREA